jgi:two-component system chemotaxis sensor kinase CheA
VKTAKYLEIFTREAEEILQILREGILHLEKEGGSAEKLQEMLRHAHTLKGSARMLSLDTLGLVAHRVEDLFKDLESGEKTFSPDLADLLLVAADALEALVAQAHSGGEIGVNVEAVLEGLETGILPEGPAAPAVLPSAVEKGERETIRASVARLDNLVNLLGEMLIVRRIFQERSRQMGAVIGRLEGFLRRLRKAENYALVKGILDDFSRLSLELERDTLNLTYLTEEIHGEAMELRMLPLSTITGDLVRMARGLARDQEKEIDLAIEGEEVELDRMMLEALQPMLLHMLRNAVDHGIETPEERSRAGKPLTGRIQLTARYEGAFVRLVLRDDGRGIDSGQVRQVAVARGLLTAVEAGMLSDEEAVYLIQRPGFSTREFITDISGRGVGMDVVKANIDRVKGNLAIHSTPGKGTEMVLLLPLTMAVVTGLIVECEGETYALPLHYVSEILRLSAGDVMTEGGREVLRVRGATLPLLSLQEILGLPKKQGIALSGRVTALVLNFREQQVACLVSRSLGVQEIVVKGMGKQLKSVEFFAGATILGDGSPALILSVPDLFTAGLQGKGTRLRQELETSRAQARKGHVLVVDDSITTRTMEKNILETHGYEVAVAVSGHDALAKISDRDYDLIVSDIEMPGMSGFELTRKLREMDRTREIPVIIVTSLASDADRRKGIEVGAQAYIVKGSFDQGTLLETVETLIG